jgi:hypothetical protein
MKKTFCVSSLRKKLPVELTYRVFILSALQAQEKLNRATPLPQTMREGFKRKFLITVKQANLSSLYIVLNQVVKGLKKRLG